ncbi:MAG: FAD binding domain-containing protein [Actinobacteria bacterium]|jgi:carbon-monoxide dehydrogenase medium subunit|nr:FAD binding domain-containing protein [Actinomycetota bacterium]
MTLLWRRPTTLDGAIEELASDDAAIYAGGVSLVLLMNLGLFEPATLVSLAAVPGLAAVTGDDEAVDLGAMCTHARLAADPILRRTHPAAADMFAGIGNVRVRSWGTLGGNLAHADPAQDPPVMLAALHGTVSVVGPRGDRVIPVEAIAEGPLSPALDPDEIVTSVRLPLAEERSGSSYLKYLPGTKDDYATVSIGAHLQFDRAGAVRQARLVAGAVGPTVVVLGAGSEVLTGHPLDPDVLDALRVAVRDEVNPSSDRRGSADYKREMAGIVAARAASACRPASARP